MKKKIVSIIAPFADGRKETGGQIVVAREYREYFQNKVDNISVRFVDTFKAQPIKMFIRSVWLICRSDIVLIILSSNGLRLYLPMIYYLNKIFKRKIFHRVIGNMISEDIRKYPSYIKCLNSFEMNYVEGVMQAEKLKTLGIKCIQSISNFRSIGILTERDISVYERRPYIYCTYSRVHSAKGITTAINGIIEINRKMGHIAAKLHVFGMIDDNYKVEFDELVKKADGTVIYKGVANPKESIKILRQYYMLLFPSVWEGEGFSGTLIEALAAGLPVISSNWSMNTEIIEDGYTGLVYDYRNNEDFIRCLDISVRNQDLIEGMRVNCIHEAVKYTPDKVMRLMLERMYLK